jgi:hypothetical protein
MHPIDSHVNVLVPGKIAPATTLAFSRLRNQSKVRDHRQHRQHRQLSDPAGIN